MESTYILTVLSTRASGCRTSNTASVSKSGQMEPNTRASSKMARRKVEASSNLQMAHYSKATSLIMKLMVLVLTFGTMERSTKVNG